MYKKFFFSILLFVFVVTNIDGGAWTQKKGNGYYKFDYRILSSSKIFGPDGDKLTIPKLTDQTFGFYGEYGIQDNLTFSAYFPFYKIAKADTAIQGNDKKSGIGDIDIGLKVRLAQIDQLVLSAGINFGIPTGENEPPGGLITGDGEFNQEVSVQAGYSLYPLPAYCNVFVSYNNRSEGYSDEFYSGIEGGYSILNNLLINLHIVNLLSLKNSNGAIKGGYGGLFANDQKYLAYGASLVYDINKNIGLSFSLESGSAGRNIQSASVFAVSIFYNDI